MITTDNLAQVLTALGFKTTPARGEYSKTFDFPAKTVEIIVNIEKPEIKYPDEITIGRTTITDFHQNENFVVLECVNRLLEKGYKPEHIYLEKPYQTGVGSSPLAHKDIQVCDNKGNPYFVIECKTAPEKGKTSSKFLSEWNKMQNLGGQLFAYYQQDRTIKFIALYTSDFIDGKVIYENKIIKLKDNKKYLKENNFTKSYETAKNQDDIFSVWKDIYKSDFSDTGIFEDEIACYQVGYLKPTINTLKTIDNAYSQKQRHEWATILRANSVGDRGLALNKLMNLFLCKVTDELENPNGLSFTWKGYTADTPFDLVDRLQKLYQIGMKNYLKKEITYYSKKEIDQAFGEYLTEGLKIQDKIEHIFNDLKYFQNGDFNFIEVYNKELFNENFEILLSVVRSLEKVKFTQNENANILGDFFETYIHDLPQQEGQYFTPTPLVDFIIYSLPVFKNNKVLDFACGAGHFLTQFFNRNKGSNSEFLGVEKDTRLAKISTIATFMNEIDQNHCVIKAANALSQDEIKNHSVNVIISNPPYSVTGFLEVLDEKDRKKFTLFNDKINLETNNSIECFFVEKTSQALQENGVLAIVLPSSFLQNIDGLYIETRKILIRDFYIIGICKLSKNAFYKTNASTCIIFAIRKPVQNDKITHINDVYLDIYNLILRNQYDKAKYYTFFDEMIKKYCQFRCFEQAEFIKLLELTLEKNSPLFDNENFQEYCKYYNKNIYQKELEKYNEKADKYKLNNAFIPSIDINNFIRNKECEKFLYFCYAQQSNPIIIKSPIGNKEEKEFLGYEWSKSKGKEGLQSLSDTVLFNQYNKFDNNRLNFYLLQQFIHHLNHKDIDDSVLVHFQNNEYLSIPTELQQYAKQIDLINMIDFSKVDFDLSIRTAIQDKIQIKSKYSLTKLENILSDNGKGKRPASFENISGEIVFYKSSQEIYKCDIADFNCEALIIGDGGTANVHYHNGQFSSSDHTYIFTQKDNSLLKFVYYFLSSNLKILNDEFTGIGIKNISKTAINNIKIPLPPLEIQQQIVAECESVDNQIQTLNNEIEELQQQSQQLINGVNAPLKPIKLIAEYTTERIAYQDTLPENYITTDNMLQKYVGITKYDGIPNIESAILYKENDILISNIRPYLRKIWFSNQTGCCSADILVVRTKENADCLSKYLFCCLRRDDFFDYSMQNVKGMKMPRGNKEHIMNYQIPLPTIETQQKIIAEFERLQQTIQHNEQQIATLKNEYNRILDKYLK
ncbi:MAG: N-6 DNA methylase [Neisseriaceae bacterium]|nr:N-6 DNA methylase [Neisseriaceae bacterium]